jgi:signal transduction histidine kinase
VNTPISAVSLHYDYDLVAARRRGRQIAALLGFEDRDQTSIATVVSEIARNALRYAGGGRVQFSFDEDDGGQHLAICVMDRGAGIENLEQVLNGRYKSSTGMGIGLVGARRLMDDFDISTGPEKGTVVTMRKRLTAQAAHKSREAIESLIQELARQKPDNPLEEIQQQNSELLNALSELRLRQEELQGLNQELEDTNRGVTALYAELDEKADHLRRADDLKTRFLSDMSHEFRTPVNSIIALTRLLDESPLESESRKQVRLIRGAANDLAALVNDLLDLAKIEAGKIDIHLSDFEVPNLFSALRGMLRPLLLNRSLALVFDDPDELPLMHTDEGKVSQILRNFISNALKFTERGEVRVSAALSPSGEAVIFSVADTGIGIAPQDLERIFEEFTQVDTPIQQREKGTGLGLPLSRKLTELLGGRIWVTSEPGAGSTFFAEIPVAFPEPKTPEVPVRPATPRQTDKLRILIVDDDSTARYTMVSFLAGPDIETMEGANGLEGITRAQAELPDLIFLDLMMPVMGGHEVLARLKSDPATAAIPVVVVTSRLLNEDERAQILTRAIALLSKSELSRELLAETIRKTGGK